MKNNGWRNFGTPCKRAGVARYSKPLHSLRKSFLTDWADRFPMHTLKEWAGHTSISTTEQFYLKVGEADYTRAAAENFFAAQ
jgi:integrase